MTDPLLTVDDVAHLLGVGRRRVYDLVEDRDPTVRLPAVRVGRRALRFRRDDVEAWVEDRRAS